MATNRIVGRVTASQMAAVSGGLTVIKEIAGGAVLNNDNRVYINVDIEGVRLSAPAPGGVLIKLEDW